MSLSVVIDEIRKAAGSVVSEIIVVDDGSVDQTADVAKAHGATVVKRSQNGGYGRAIKAGISSASSEYVIIMDADGQHDPRDIQTLFSYRSTADLVIGERRSQNRSGLWRFLGKFFLRKLAEYLSGQKIPDLNSGMKLFKKAQFIGYAVLLPNGMSFSDATTLLYLHRELRVVFVPINVRPRKGGKSVINFNTGLETVISVLNMIMLFNPLKIFLRASIIFLFLGFGWAIPFLWMGRGLTVTSLLLILLGVLTFFFGMVAEQISQIRKQMILTQETELNLDSDESRFKAKNILGL